jgi:HlyD family secretion protein
MLAQNRPMRVTLPLLALAWITACSEDRPDFHQGYVEGEFVRVAAPFAGVLQTLSVVRGAQVGNGDPLFALEQENETAARREAEERLKTVEAQLANLTKGRRPSEIDAIRAQLAQAESAAKLSAAQLQRREELVARNFVSKESLDEVRSAYERDRQRVAELKAQLDTARLPARPDEIKAAQYNLGAAQAELAQAEWRLAQKSVRAPVGGLVQDTYYVVGEWVNANQPVVSLLPPGNIKVRFFVNEQQLGAVKIGQDLRIDCDGCPGTVRAQVSFIAPQAEYTPPVVYSRDERAKLVYLIEARPAAAEAVKLHPGQPVEVRFADGTPVSRVRNSQ